MADFGFVPDDPNGKIDPAVQRARDQESLRIIQEERKGLTDPKDIAANEREQQRLIKSGVIPKFDHSLFAPDAPKQQPVSTDRMQATPPAPSKLDAGLAAVRGFGDSASLGLTRYPAAALMTGYNKVFGDGSMSYQDALNATREQDKQDKAEHPTARLSGQVAGGLLNAAGTGGSGLLATAGKTALAGGLSGYTANAGNENAIQDTATGAAIGGVAGGVAGLAGKAKDAYLRSAYKGRNDEFIAKGKEALQNLLSGKSELKPVLDKAGITGEDAVNSAVQRLAATTRGKPNIAGVPVPAAAVQEARTINRGLKAEGKNAAASAATGGDLNAMTKGPLKYDAIGSFNDLLRLGASSAGGIGTGAAIGAGADILSGNEGWSNATSGAMLGGGYGILSSKSNLLDKTAKAALSRLPQGLPETAARAGTTYTANQVAQSQQQNRLQTVIDEAKAKAEARRAAKNPVSDFGFVPN